jgi:23S rRNA pseudouridine2605 synthase
MTEDVSQIRLNRFLAMVGIASRRKAEDIIKSGSIKINGIIVKELGTKVLPSDKVTLNGNILNIKEKRTYIVLFKPNDCITTVKDEKDRKTVLDIVKIKERVFPIGRLDRKTTGVLLLTNDGEFANRLMHPKYNIEKEYKATLDKPIDRENLKKIFEGITLEDGQASASQVSTGSSKSEVYVTVHEGRNHLVRRMFEKIGFEVLKLERVRYGNITTDGLKRGEWRNLKSSEVLILKEMVKMV